MKYEEKIADDYLKSAYSDIVYEPDGNIPPDFKVNNHIGVEVRRLNQNIHSGNRYEGIEQDQIRLKRRLNKVFGEFHTTSEISQCYWIGLAYHRPLGNLNIVLEKARTELKRFLLEMPKTPYEIKLSEKIAITVAKSNKVRSEIFRIGTEADFDSGGFVIPMYADNVNLCIKEKSDKIRIYKNRYDEWWLLLVDFLAGGFAAEDKDSFLQQIKGREDWNRIIIINPYSVKEIISF
jgi:hypothetical protein